MERGEDQTDGMNKPKHLQLAKCVVLKAMELITNIIVTLLRVSLEDLSNGSVCLSTAERQTPIGKKPDIMVMENVEDDSVKLWRETLDGISFVGTACRPTSNQFGIAGVQVAGEDLYLNVLVKDANGIPRYFHLNQAQIPFTKNTSWRKFMAEVSKNSSSSISNSNADSDVIPTTLNETESQPSNTSFTFLYEKLCNAIILADRKTQEAIFCYCNFGKYRFLLRTGYNYNGGALIHILWAIKITKSISEQILKESSLLCSIFSRKKSAKQDKPSKKYGRWVGRFAFPTLGK
ncbi:11450_t:CDS:2 [Ambispora leptoticha]|uniref:11450_t:CDS:1 n=1 Tax=Ambispora leptoticha TaxID=144679 RepID=A0A9N8VAK2_9GLOM|nr:11450_t:CDS:2 [Ambispora leptoticha]